MSAAEEFTYTLKIREISGRVITKEIVSVNYITIKELLALAQDRFSYNFLEYSCFHNGVEVPLETKLSTLDPKVLILKKDTSSGFAAGIAGYFHKVGIVLQKDGEKSWYKICPEEKLDVIEGEIMLTIARDMSYSASWFVLDKTSKPRWKKISAPAESSFLTFGKDPTLLISLKKISHGVAAAPTESSEAMAKAASVPRPRPLMRLLSDDLASERTDETHDFRGVDPRYYDELMARLGTKFNGSKIKILSRIKGDPFFMFGDKLKPLFRSIYDIYLRTHIPLYFVTIHSPGHVSLFKFFITGTKVSLTHVDSSSSNLFLRQYGKNIKKEMREIFVAPDGNVLDPEVNLTWIHYQKYDVGGDMSGFCGILSILWLLYYLQGHNKTSESFLHDPNAFLDLAIELLQNETSLKIEEVFGSMFYPIFGKLESESDMVSVETHGMTKAENIFACMRQRFLPSLVQQRASFESDYFFLKLMKSVAEKKGIPFRMTDIRLLGIAGFNYLRSELRIELGGGGKKYKYLIVDDFE
jgi:hypothetical protein